MHIQKIQNLERRISHYKEERLRFISTTALWIVSISIPLSIGLAYAFNSWYGAGENWLLVGAVVSLFVSVPPLVLTMPKRPTIEDVHADQSIRRAAGMDDTVDD